MQEMRLERRLMVRAQRVFRRVDFAVCWEAIGTFCIGSDVI